MAWRDGGSRLPVASEPPPSVPSDVERLATCFLSIADSVVPGLIQGLYLVGSVALGDFRKPWSDVDFVALSGHRPEGAELEGLAAVHGTVRSRYPLLHFEGTHLTWSDLVAGPVDCAPAPFNHEGRFSRAGTFAIHPVTWHELAGHGLSVRGPEVGGVSIWRDHTVLRAWTLRNLVEYWRPWTSQYRNGPSALDGHDALVCWGVLGIARLHYTVTTGGIISKTGAGQYALQAFEGRWHRIISEALRVRAEPTLVSHYVDLSERRMEVADFVTLAIESTLRAGAV